MKVNKPNAAKNCYDGIKAITDAIDDSENYRTKEDLVEELEKILVEYQPLLAAYCILEVLDNA